VRWQFAFMDLYSSQAKLPVHRLLSRMLIYTLTIETIGAALLFPAFLKHRNDPLQALWDAIFHSVSSFCNAGFSTFSDSLVSFNHNPYVLGVISMNIILGGLGFFVILEIIRNTKTWIMGLRRDRPRITFSLHTRIVLLVSAILIIGGAALLYHLEADRTFARMGLIDRAANALFHSITCRTAGFNAVDIGAMKETSLFTMIILMFIGGSPGSFAGGIKTTTFWIVLCLIWAKFRGHSEVVLWKRTIDNDNTEKSATLVILALIFVSVTTFLMLYVNGFKVGNAFQASLFEVTSAFGTVGLSTGITPQMSVAGKIITCVVMLTGRLGPLTLFASMTFNKKKMMLQYPKENIMVG
jgi:trk system potassium uptake protein